MVRSPGFRLGREPGTIDDDFEERSDFEEGLDGLNDGRLSLGFLDDDEEGCLKEGLFGEGLLLDELLEDGFDEGDLNEGLFEEGLLKEEEDERLEEGLLLLGLLELPELLGLLLGLFELLLLPLSLLPKAWSSAVGASRMEISARRAMNFFMVGNLKKSRFRGMKTAEYRITLL